MLKLHVRTDMDNTPIKEIVIPISDYASVHDDANLLSALIALESENRVHMEEQPYRHRAILVLNKNGDVIGKASQIDMLRALEPDNYQLKNLPKKLSRFGLNKAYLSTFYGNFSFWSRSKEEIRRILVNTKITEVMYKPTDNQHVDINDTLSVAMHQIVTGKHQSLLVLEGNKIIGILRSIDLFNKFYSLIMDEGE